MSRTRSLDDLSVLAARATSRRQLLGALLAAPLAAWAHRPATGAARALGPFATDQCGPKYYICEATCEAKKVKCLPVCLASVVTTAEGAAACAECVAGLLTEPCDEKCHKDNCPCPSGTEVCGGFCCDDTQQCNGFSCVPKKCGPCTTPTWGGGCANNCGPGDSCCNDQCIPQDQFCCNDSPCPNQNLCCADGCKDPTDPQTCGTCDNACPPGTTCNNGSCNCGAGGPCPECYYTCCNDSCVFSGGAGCYTYSLETGICLTWTGCDQGFVTCGDPGTCPPWPGTC